MPELDGPPRDLPRLIEVLDRYEVEIVGGAAAYAYGAERPTEGADCVVRRERTNLVLYEELVVQATLLYAMALRPELPPWRTSFGPKSAPIGTRTERPYPSYALYEMPLLAKMRLCHRSLLGAANVSPGLYPPLQELGERRDSVGLSWCGWP